MDFVIAGLLLLIFLAIRESNKALTAVNENVANLNDNFLLAYERWKSTLKKEPDIPQHDYRERHGEWKESKEQVGSDWTEKLLAYVFVLGGILVLLWSSGLLP